MKKPFKKLFGQRVFLSMPILPESAIILSEAVQQSIVEKEQEKYQKLTVYATGELVTTVSEGDVVLVNPEILQRAQVVPLSKTHKVILINALDIIMVW